MIYPHSAADYSPLPLNKNGATSETPGGFATAKGAGRQTASAERPTRAVSRPFSTPSPILRRDARRDAVADDLLDQAVADRHAAGDGDMGADRAAELDEAEKARAARRRSRRSAARGGRSGRRRRSRRGSARGLMAVTSDTRLGGLGDLALAPFRRAASRAPRSATSMRSRPSMIAAAASCTCARARAVSGRSR